MYALILLRYRAPLEDIVAATDAHRSYLRSLHARGILLASGPFDPRTGGAILLRLPEGGPSLEEIRDGDPFHQLGLVEHELLRWVPVLGTEGLDRL
jgi:uncharacterized protein YciI